MRSLAVPNFIYRFTQRAVATCAHANWLSALGFVALACTGCGYAVDGRCELCTGDVIPLTGVGCEKHDAVSNFQSQCADLGGESFDSPEDDEAYPIWSFTACRTANTPLDVLPSLGLREYLQKHVGANPTPQSLPDTNCPAKPGFKVVFHEDCWPARCGAQQKEVQVLYLKSNSEFVTLSKFVAPGGTIEFLCEDAAIDEDDGFAATFRVAAQNDCDLTIEEGGYTAVAFTNKLKDGGELVIHQNPENCVFITTITNPRVDALTETATTGARGELRPIPDPMFATQQR
jgi:hypothetical protein